jgi:hypothetical protein
MKRRLSAILLISGSLLFGLLIYYTQRTGSLVMNDVLDRTGGMSFRVFIQSSIASFQIPDHAIYSLPDGLWMLALTITILLIWDFRIHKKCLTWIAITISAGTAFEFLQYLHLIDGWFDPIDLIYMLAGAMLPVSFILIKNRLCITN